MVQLAGDNDNQYFTFQNHTQCDTVKLFSLFLNMQITINLNVMCDAFIFMDLYEHCR